MNKFITTDFVLYSAIEGQTDDYTKFDMIVLREGPGKHKVYIEEYGQFFTEFFPKDILSQFLPILEGTPLEAYRVAGTNVGDDDGLVHPTAEQAELTPEGLVLHGVGLWENTRIAPHPEGGNALWSVGVMNDTRAALDVRETVRLALERGSQFVPAPSINGYMLWEPVIENGEPYLMARKIVNLRSTEFVNRPAAGGRLYAVVEGNQMNLLAMLKGYCAAHAIAHKTEAATVAELMDSVPDKDAVLTHVAGLFESDESEALAVVAKAFETPALADESPAVEVKGTEDDMVKDTVKIDAPMLAEPEDVAIPDVATLASDAPDLSGVTELLGQVTEGLQTVTNQNKGLVKDLNQRFSALDKKIKAVDQFLAGQNSRENKKLLVSHVQESEMPKHRKNFWVAQVESGKVQSLDMLKGFMADDIDAEMQFKSQMLEGMTAEELPVSVRNLLSVEAPQEDKAYLRAKLMFGAPMTEGERSAVNASGLRAYRDVKHMYSELVPGDLENGMLTGMAYGGPGVNNRKYEEWKRGLISRQSMQSVTGGVEVVRRGDFTGILLDVVQQVAMARWDMQQLDAFDLCHVGPGFQDFEDSNLIITGAAPDMSRWNNVSGFPNIETGQRQKVTTEADVLGGILRWSWDVILNDRNGSALNIIQTDVDNAIDATYRTIVRAIINAIMGWTTTGINTATPTGTSDGVLYQAPAPSGTGALRANYLDADGRSYDALVKLLDLMQNQVDIAKAGETAQPLIMLPGRVLCVTNFAADARQMFTAEYKPSPSETNKLGVAKTPQVIGVHRSFLHNRDDFVAMLPDPIMQGVVELQYFMNKKKPSIVWQTAPEVGRTFENGEIAARLDMPVRVTLARPKGAFAAFEA